MNAKIWRILAKILFYRNDLIEAIKPFFDKLKNENINEEKYIPLLQTFSKNQLEDYMKMKFLQKKNLIHSFQKINS